MLGFIVKGFFQYKHNYWGCDKIHELSEKRFRKTIEYAYINSKFYRNLYNEKGIKYDDLKNINIEDIPKINKDMVREHFYDIATVKLKKESVERAIKSKKLIARVGSNYIVHTSGSTGVPCMFLYDSHGINTIEANFVRLNVGGKNPIDKKDFPIRSVYIAPVGNGYACTTLAMNGIKKYHAKGIVLDAHIPIDRWKSIINKYSPTFLSGYPSCLNIISELQKKGEIDFKPKKIITGGEPLSHEQALYYSSIFSADVIDYYGCTESILLGSGGSSYDGIYLFDDLNYLELSRDNKLIITPLYNKAFPLIRYELNDVVKGFTKEKYGEFPYTHIDSIMGRNEDLMWFKNVNNKMDFLHPLFIDDLDVKGIREYQFEQLDDTSFIFRYTKMPECTQDIEKDIKYQINYFLERKRLQNVNYSVTLVNRIAIDPSCGKIKMVIKRSNQ